MATKVFVGNLAWVTTDQELAEAFRECGKVKSGVIITRGRRSLGYGFVEFHTHEDALSAIEKKNKTNLNNREIKVELVRDSTERRKPERNNKPQQQQQSLQQGDENWANANKETGPARRKNNYNNYNYNNNNNYNNYNYNNNNNYYRRNRNFQRRVPQDRENIDVNTQKNRNNNNKPPKEKILSKTAVFVANLPYSVNDDDLKKMFSEWNVKGAHVVTTKSNRSRGYGFVDFATEADQQAAIKARNNFPVPSGDKTRNISVFVSHSVAPTENTEII